MLWAARIEPLGGNTGQRPARNLALEGLRGCAALAVLYTHLTAPLPRLDPAYIPSSFFWHFETGIMAVMLFFILSGYVIGLTNRAQADSAQVQAYLFRRAVRLLPIYLVAVVIGWLVRPAATAWLDVAGHFLFLQNDAADTPFHVALLPGNTNLWSLHYEAIYYLVFLLVWWRRPRLVPVLASLLAIGLLGAILPGFSRTAAWLASGLVLWLAGLVAAWRLPDSSPAEHTPWPSAALLAMATWQLKALHHLFSRMGYRIEWVSGITFDCLDCLPVLLWLFLLVAQRPSAWLRWFEFVAWLVPASYVAWRLCLGSWQWQSQAGSATVLLLFAALLRGWKPGLTFFRRLAPLGSISYGVYVMGAPIQQLLLQLFPACSGHWWSYAIRFGAVVMCALFTGWVLEQKLQPLIKASLFRNSIAPANAVT